MLKSPSRLSPLCFFVLFPLLSAPRPPPEKPVLRSLPERSWQQSLKLKITAGKCSELGIIRTHAHAQARSLTGPPAKLLSGKRLGTITLGSISLTGQRMAEVAAIMCMKNVSSHTVTPTYKESLFKTNQKGGSLAGTDVKINGQENRFIRSA